MCFFTLSPLFHCRLKSKRAFFDCYSWQSLTRSDTNQAKFPDLGINSVDRDIRALPLGISVMLVSAMRM